MTAYLIVVNGKQSLKTERFWIQNAEIIQKELADSTIFVPDFDMEDWPLFEDYSTLVLVGDDGFFSQTLNVIYQQKKFSDKTQVAFIPDVPRESSICKRFKLPFELHPLLELIQAQHAVFVDLIKCSYIDRSGFPATYLATNDILIGASPSSIFPFASIFFKWLLSAFLPKRKQDENTVTIVEKNRELYNGPYILAILLLGSYITKGPKIRSSKKRYCRKFGLFQFKSQSILKMTTSLSNVCFGKGKQQILNQWELDEAEFKSFGKERNVIADGVHIGRLPANFTLLPNAVKIISPFNMIKLKNSWKRMVPSAAGASDPLTRTQRREEEREKI